VEQEALSLIRFYSTPPISKDDLLAHIRADATVSEPVRERALEFARQWPEGRGLFGNVFSCDLRL
jgi:hypothetical protein